MRRYELMLVLRPDTADDRVQQILDRTTRGIAEADGQIVKVSPWGRRRLAYPIGAARGLVLHRRLRGAERGRRSELEHSLNITEELLRHLITRVERPASARRAGCEGRRRGRRGGRRRGRAFIDRRSTDEEEDEPIEVIDESESEAAPRATD